MSGRLDETKRQMTPPADDGSSLLEQTEMAQRRASAPDTSAWVSANAGSGKTHVLKMRVQRLLLAGVAPDRILCLTFTKAAAAEMSKRVFKDLGDWAVAPNDALANRITGLTGSSPDQATLHGARRLFARAIETPGGLKVQTIHAFCQKLLQRFPLEAGLPPGFETIDDAKRDDLMGRSVTAMLTSATDGTDPELGEALKSTIAYANEDGFKTVLDQALKQKHWLELMAGLRALDQGKDAVDFFYRGKFGLPKSVNDEQLIERMSELLGDNKLIAAAESLCSSKSVKDRTLGAGLREVAATQDPQLRAELLTQHLLTRDLIPAKTNLATKAVADAEPWIREELHRARDAIAELVQQRIKLKVTHATQALNALAQDVTQRYQAAKLDAAVLDFSDLINKTAELLKTSEHAQWVLYKLDGGIDHILVDEAQDTSREQWTIAKRLADEFFGPDDARERPRTMFAVGDEKQSIYSFQGAEPRLFAAAGEDFRSRAVAAGETFQQIPLRLSFRTVSPILRAVDTVFGDDKRTPGLMTLGQGVRHEVHRAQDAGLVEIWDLEAQHDSDKADAFSPLSDQAEQSAQARLCQRIAETVANWLRDGRMLEAHNRPVRAGDILILLRRRRPLGPMLIAALKDRGIPVAGADRMMLTEQLIVQDLIALGEFLTLPENDLALANTLKSPFFDYDDDDLMRFATGKRGSLWSAIIKSAKTNERDSVTVDILKHWRSKVDYLPPFEMFAELLNARSHLAAHERIALSEGLAYNGPYPDGGLHCRTYRDCLLRRLGPDAADPLDVFLELALKYDEQASPSLMGFLHWLSESQHEIKRDMETTRDEVRLMTIHGAKGLEAPIVILPDTTSDPSKTPTDRLVDLPNEAPEDPFSSAIVRQVAWTVPNAKAVDLIKEAKDERRGAITEEANRLLYVAMTRAEDELYICGAAPKKNLPKACWYLLMREAIEPLCAEVTTEAGGRVLRLASKQTGPYRSTEAAPTADEDDAPPPAWMFALAPREPTLQIPLLPSKLAPLETDEIGDPVEPTPVQLQPETGPPIQLDLLASGPARTGATRSGPDDSAADSVTGEPFGPGASAGPGPDGSPPQPSPRHLAQDNRFLRGNLTHALLQHLPNVPQPSRKQAGEQFVEHRGQDLTSRQRASIVRETLAILDDPRFSLAFGPGSRAEVSLVAEIPNPHPAGTPLKIAGQIDRLVTTDHDVLIIDFKTNRPPPDVATAVPDAYLLQLAAYRLAIGQIFPGKSVRAALLWTDGTNLMEIPEELLDSQEHKLWKL